MQLSYWEIKNWFSNVDFTIVGSGIVGLHCALNLRELFPKSKILIKLRGISNFINPYQRIVKSSGIKLLHVPIQYSPIYKVSVPIVTTIHDVQEFHFPETEVGEMLWKAVLSGEINSVSIGCFADVEEIE